MKKHIRFPVDETHTIKELEQAKEIMTELNDYLTEKVKRLEGQVDPEKPNQTFKVKELEQEKLLLNEINAFLTTKNVELEKSKKEFEDMFLSNVPPAARADALNAIDKVRKLEEQKFFRPCLYYVVLIDLADSTIASARLPPEENIKRIKQFVTFTIDALNQIPARNIEIFLSEIGDASLFLFTNFQDILNWAAIVDKSLKAYNEKCKKEGRPEVYQMYSRKCLHIGEVHFTEEADPVALAINQVFKIEKYFKKGQLGITDAVKQVIMPRIHSGQIKAEMITKTAIPGESIPRYLWNITVTKG